MLNSVENSLLIMKDRSLSCVSAYLSSNSRAVGRFGVMLLCGLRAEQTGTKAVQIRTTVTTTVLDAHMTALPARHNTNSTREPFPGYLSNFPWAKWMSHNIPGFCWVRTCRLSHIAGCALLSPALIRHDFAILPDIARRITVFMDRRSFQQFRVAPERLVK